MAKANEEVEVQAVIDAPSSFPKGRWLLSGRFTPQQKDVLTVALVDGVSYTFDEANKALNKFLKTEVL